MAGWILATYHSLNGQQALFAVMWQQKAPQLLNTWLTRDYYGDHYTECHLILSAWNHVRYLFFARHFVNMELNSALHIEWIKWPQTVNVVSSSLIFLLHVGRGFCSSYYLGVFRILTKTSSLYAGQQISQALSKVLEVHFSQLFWLILGHFGRKFWEELSF